MSLRLPQCCVAVAALLLAVTACGGNPSAGRAPVQIVHVTERDFVIRLPHELDAGTVRFVVKNNGPVSHEFILVRAPHGRLPMRADGITVDEDALEPLTVGTLETAGPGPSRSLQVHLAPGRYIVFCNMAGHYMSGMSSRLRVQS
jgi:uncharacterized cupredoxin-like copper-binding protein